MSFGYNDLMNNFAAGSVAGFASITVCHPFDVIRTKIQLSKTHTTALRVLKTQSLFTLYTGFSGPFFAQGIYKSTVFVTNSYSNKILFQDIISYKATFVSGLIAGAINSFVVCPVEFIRTRSITSGPNSVNRSTFKLWQSIVPTVLRDSPGVAVYFLTFQMGKDLGKTLLENSSSKVNNESHSSGGLQNAFIVKLVAASLAGVTYWIWALPIDAIKTNIEYSLNRSHNNSSINHPPVLPAISGAVEQYSSFRHMAQVTRNILKTQGGGFRSLYRGWGVAVSRGIPSAAITLNTYDYAIDYLKKRDETHQTS